ncbi:MAG: nascent polypeptide-associated complex protein [Candidatus Omnitrophica bacterium]|nr:nascent polypeptide-associated complex protein [Candidatus Omnitrophota bacterium]
MIPGINPQMMKQLMKQMNMENVDASEVIIKTPEGELVIENPEVMKMKVMGKTAFPITGEPELRESKTKISSEDIKLVMEKAGVKEDIARESLESCDEDIAEAIILCENMKGKK